MTARIVTDIRMPAARATGNRDRSMPAVGCSDPVGHWGDPRTAPFDARATPFRLLALASHGAVRRPRHALPAAGSGSRSTGLHGARRRAGPAVEPHAVTDTPFPAAETGVAQEALRDAAEPSEQSMTTLTVERDYGLIWEGERPAVAKAYVAAQKSMEAIKKAAKNDHFKTKYADLAEVVEAVVPALNEHGIGVIQNAVNDGEWVSITTTLLHESGSSVSSTLRLRPVKNDPQGIGSAITYGRRYSLLAMTGAAPEDDDGNASSAPRQQHQQQQQREPDFPSTAAQYAADQLRQAKTKEEFTHFWEGQKTGLREALDDGNFAHVIGVMRTEAKRFAEAPSEKPTGDETPFDQKEAA